MLDDIFEIFLKIALILFIILGFILSAGLTIYFYKENIINRDEQIKILEQSLNEQIQEKEVYMKMLEDEYEQYTR